MKIHVNIADAEDINRNSLALSHNVKTEMGNVKLVIEWINLE